MTIQNNAVNEAANMKLRAFISGLCAFGLAAFIAWLNVLGFVDSSATIVAGAAGFGLLTWGRGLPIPLPAFLVPIAAAYRKDLGEVLWTRITGIAAGLSPYIQAAVYGVVVFVVQSALNGFLTPRLGADGSAVATIVAAALCAFALRVLVHRYADERGYRRTFGHSAAAWANLFPQRIEVNPYIGMALMSLVTAVLTWLTKTALVSMSGALTDWRLLVAVGVVIVLIAIVPGPVQRGLARLFYRPKETSDVRDD